MFSSATKSAAQGGSYNLTKSLRFRQTASAYLNRTPSSSGNRRTFTWSGWVKIGKLGAFQSFLECVGPSTPGTRTGFMITDLQGLQFFTDNTSTSNVVSSNLFRDPAAWYHIVLAVDTTQATASNRVKMYVNGVQITSFSTANYPSQNLDTYFDTTYSHTIGKVYDPFYSDFYLAEVNFVDGQQLTPASFGSTNAITGVWQPARYTGTYGTNGFYLSFTNTASTTTLGYDTSGNSNNWTCNNISLTSGVTYDSMNDVPTLTSATAANYPVINNIFLGSYGGTMTPYAGNLQTGTVQANADNNVLGSMGMPSTGKYYWEVTITGGASSPSGGIGYYLGVSDAIGQYSFGWQSKSGSPFSTTYTTNDVLGFASNKDAGTIECFKNGVSVGSTSLADSYKFFIFYYWGNDGTGAAIAVNFGQQPFKYSVPSGFKALNSYNLPDSTILAGNKVMDATTYTGNTTGQSIVNSGAMKPDLVWIKARNQSFDHVLTDSVRGTNKYLVSNSINTEGTFANGVTSFNSNGFTLGNDTGAFNSSAGTFVGWQWQAGQGSTSSNTAGSITSTVSVNPTAGFSIVTYTGNGSNPQTIGHGLGVTPALIIVKTRSGGTGSWITYHQSLGANYYLILDGNAAASADSQAWNNTAPTSSVFTIGKYCNWANGWDYVAYCWAQIDGFSKFGSYGGTGDTTYNSFQYCGFRPKFLMWKCSSNSANDWNIIDTSRDTYNAAAKYLRPDSTIAEQNDGPLFDILSNGFKPRTFFSDTNRSGYTYVYAAFAENPFKNALAR